MHSDFFFFSLHDRWFTCKLLTAFPWSSLQNSHFLCNDYQNFVRWYTFSCCSVAKMVAVSSLFVPFSLLPLPLLLFTGQYLGFLSAMQLLQVDLHWLGTKLYLQPPTSEEAALIRVTAGSGRDKIYHWPVWCHAACHCWKLAAIMFQLVCGFLMHGCHIKNIVCSG